MAELTWLELTWLELTWLELPTPVDRGVVVGVAGRRREAREGAVVGEELVEQRCLEAREEEQRKGEVIELGARGARAHVVGLHVVREA